MVSSALLPNVEMTDETREQRTIQEVCENAEIVDDSSKLRRLTKQIDQILEAEVAQLKSFGRNPS